MAQDAFSIVLDSLACAEAMPDGKAVARIMSACRTLRDRGRPDVSRLRCLLRDRLDRLFDFLDASEEMLEVVRLAGEMDAEIMKIMPADALIAPGMRALYAVIYVYYVVRAEDEEAMRLMATVPEFGPSFIEAMRARMHAHFDEIDGLDMPDVEGAIDMDVIRTIVTGMDESDDEALVDIIDDYSVRVMKQAMEPLLATVARDYLSPVDEILSKGFGLENRLNIQRICGALSNDVLCCNNPSDSDAARMILAAVDDLNAKNDPLRPPPVVYDDI
jgi:hypothetical protein